MSWLARSLANSLRLDDDDAENDVASVIPPQDHSPVNRNVEETHQSLSEGTEMGKGCESIDDADDDAHARGVKEDLTELKQTLTRQLWGVASFLVPPPSSEVRSFSGMSDRSESREGEEASDSAGISGIGHDMAEIGGRLREMASNYYPFGSEGEREGEEMGTEEVEEWMVIGITDEVLAFATNIAMHPETWLDFPLDEEEDLDDFRMSNAQQEHALAIEQLAPRLAALRIELCPCHMSESYFWKVYFVLLHSRLNKHDAEVLSTPQVMEARAMWMQELHKQTKPESDWYGRNTLYVKEESNVLHKDFEYTGTFDYNQNTSMMTTDHETEKHPVVSTEMQFVDKPVIEEKRMTTTEVKDPLVGSSSKILVPEYEDDEDDWLDEEDSDLGSYKATIPLGNEEDISFSDLEDDASGIILIKSKILPKGNEMSTT